jgi:flagellar biogenesis protein FliO
MPCMHVRRSTIVGVGAVLIVGLLDLDPGSGPGLVHRAANAEQAQGLSSSPSAMPTRVAVVVREPTAPISRPLPPRGSGSRRLDGHSGGSGGWWLGTAGIALVLAVCGGISLAARRGWPQARAGGVLRVVGRTSLSPRHTVHLLGVGERVLIVGTGPQGAPTLLGELTDPEDLRRFVAREPEDPVGDINDNENENENQIDLWWRRLATSPLGRMIAAYRRPAAGDDR